MRVIRLILIAGLCTGLAGCMMGPNYERPPVPTPAGFRTTDSAAVADSAALADSALSLADAPWWELFQDTVLQELIREALVGNYDLRAAAARVDEYRALIGVAKADLYPQIDASAGASYRQRSVSEEGGTGDKRYGSFRADVGLSWELDLWGRVRRQGEAATARFWATEQARRGIVQGLVATVAQAYINLRELDLELEVARRTLDIRQGTLTLFRQRMEGGVASQLEVSQAAADVASTEAAIADLERRIPAQENLINFLIGQGPGPIARGATLSEQYLPPEVPAGLPSTLLERRPDVLEAEEALIAANADIGAAKASMFPTISLTGLLGIATRALSDATSQDAVFWSAGGGVLAPIFYGGRLRKNYQATIARTDQATALYYKAAMNAFRETADALVDVQKSREIRAAAERGVTELREAARLALIRYDGGLSSYLEVLDADRQLFAAENELARVMGFQVNTYVNLYRALGGGWNADALAQQADSTGG